MKKIGCPLLLLAFLLTVTGRPCSAAGSPRRPRDMDASRPDAARTSFQVYPPYDPKLHLPADVAMVYGVDPGLPERLASWRAAGYRTYVMTGVAWGSYQGYQADGETYRDLAQTRPDGTPISHGGDVYYLVPTKGFVDHLTISLGRAIDAGAEAIALEEPEFWVAGSYGKAFQREWQDYYGIPWEAPDSSVTGRERADRLKYYLYRRAIGQAGDFIARRAREIGRPVGFYVATHSLLNYANWGIVSPESSLADMPHLTGLIGQVWTGTARTPNHYGGVFRQRTFENAFLEYGSFATLVRGTPLEMWFLADPVEDDPNHTWTDYRENYRATLVASLFSPECTHYEVMPWPDRVFLGTYPTGRGDERRAIPPDYATSLLAVINALRDMDQPAPSRGGSEFGVLVADSMMFQRGEPHDSNPDLRGFYALALPLLKHGRPVEPVHLEHLDRPSYLASYRALLLSYQFMKPPAPETHSALADWVRNGGALIYVGDEHDPYNAAAGWWNRAPLAFAAPQEHLFVALGLPRRPARGLHRVGKGAVYVLPVPPQSLATRPDGPRIVRDAVRNALRAAESEVGPERNYLLRRRGPYLVAAVMDESVSDEPLRLQGHFLDLFDSRLAVRGEVVLKPGQQAFLLDLDAAPGAPPLDLARGDALSPPVGDAEPAEAPRALASAARITDWRTEGRQVTFRAAGPEGTTAAIRLRLPAPPASIEARRGEKKVAVESAWDGETGTELLVFPNAAEGAGVTISW